MEIVDVAVDFNGSVWGNWEEEENSLLKKASPLTELCKPAMELNGRYASAAKTDSYELSRLTLVAAGGSWSTEVSGVGDSQGNSKVTAEASIGKETESGFEVSASGGVSVSSDKD